MFTRDSVLRISQLTLLGCLVSLIAFLMYLVVHWNHQKSPKPNRWLPSHFTIPIFSPFTSVVRVYPKTLWNFKDDSLAGGTRNISDRNQVHIFCCCCARWVGILCISPLVCTYTYSNYTNMIIHIVMTGERSIQHSISFEYCVSAVHK